MMNLLKVLAAASCIAASTAASSNPWENQPIYTVDGIVKFVPDTITSVELADMLFPAPQSTKPLTRSIFDETTHSGPEVKDPVAVAMLINFEFASSMLTKDSKARLDVVGKMLNETQASDKGLVIEGHTDVTGPEDYNMTLSFDRAESVKRYLMSRHKIDNNRLELDGKGESRLIDPAEPGGSINRRVQFKAS